MMTVGEEIKKTRLSQNISIDQLSQTTKIDSQKLILLESNQFARIPNTTAKGYIKIIARALGAPPEPLIALYRRDFKTDTPSQHLTLRNRFGLAKRPGPMIYIFVGVLVFVSYLIFQFRAVITPPKLEIVRPEPQAVTGPDITIEGKTDPGSIITINSTNTVKPDSHGYFKETIIFDPLIKEIVVVSTNRYHQSNSQKIPIVIISQ